MKKSILFVMCLLLFLSLFTACDKENAVTEETSEAITAEKVTDEAEKEEDKTEATEEAATEQPVVDIHFLAVNSHDIETEFGRAILDELGIRTNTNIIIEQPPQDGAAEKIQIIFSSGDTLPDVVGNFFSPSDSLFNKVKNEGLIVPVTQYIAASQNLLANIPQATLDAFTDNGEIWALPTIQNMVFSRGLYLREDWLDTLGIDLGLEENVITTEKFMEIMNAFTYDDPDQDGTDNTYGFVKPNSSGWMTVVPEMILAAFGSGLGWQMDENGNLTDTTLTANWENTKQALEFYKSMFDEKVVDPEILLLTSEQVRDRLYSGKAGSVYGFGSVGSGSGFTTGIRKTDPDATLKWINALEGISGCTERTESGIKSTGVIVTVDCEYPDRVVQLFDYAVSDEGQILCQHGVEGLHFESVDENYIPTRTEEQQAIYDEFVRSRPWQWAFRQATPNVLLHRTFWEALEMDETYISAYYTWWEASTNPNHDLNYGYFPSKSEAVINMDLEWATLLAKYLIGDADIEELDDMRDRYLEEGYNDYMTECDAIYKEKMS